MGAGVRKREWVNKVGRKAKMNSDQDEIPPEATGCARPVGSHNSSREKDQLRAREGVLEG